MHPQRMHKGHVTKNVQRQCDYKELMKLSKKLWEEGKEE